MENWTFYSLCKTVRDRLPAFSLDFSLGLSGNGRLMGEE